MNALFKVAKSFRSKAVLLSGLILFSSLPGIAQDQAPAKKRPTLGLALQGGGALGLAHVGVITWLEEHHIPIDYVSGTSMGGLVGGVYATGHNATELRQVVNSINWDQVMAGQTPFDDFSFRRKEDSRDYPNSLEFGLRKGLQFPSGFNSGQQVLLILDKVSAPYSEVKSFNDLPIPFACVATDLVSGKAHVFRSGSLSLALRSTMSLPGIFSPVRDDGAIYADGGLLQNLPVQVAKKMGADVVLGVHLAEENLKPDANLSSFAVLGQSISVMISANELESMEMADLLLSVPVQKWGALSFDDADAIIKAGYDAAQAKSKMLLTLAVDDATWNEYIAERNARRITTTPIPTFVAVKGVNAELSKKVETLMAGVVGKPLNYDELDAAIMRLKGTGRYSTLSYGFVEQNGKQGLEIKTEENAVGPPVVRPLILVDGSSLKNVTFNMGARVTWYDIGGFRSEWRNDIILFSQYGLRSEYYHPFTPTSHWFVAPRVLAYSDPLYFYDNNQLVSTYRKNCCRWRPRLWLSVRNCGRTALRLRRRLGRFPAPGRKSDRAAKSFRRLCRRQGSVSVRPLGRSCHSSQRSGPSSRFPVDEQQSIGGGSLSLAGGRVNKLLQAERAGLGVLERICRHHFQLLRHWLAAVFAGWLAHPGRLRNQRTADGQVLPLPVGISPTDGEAAAASGKRRLCPGNVRGLAGLRATP